MSTEEWLREIFNMIPNDRRDLIVKWAEIVSELGYKISFD